MIISKGLLERVICRALVDKQFRHLLSNKPDEALEGTALYSLAEDFLAIRSQEYLMQLSTKLNELYTEQQDEVDTDSGEDPPASKVEEVTARLGEIGFDQGIPGL